MPDKSAPATQLGWRDVGYPTDIQASLAAKIPTTLEQVVQAVQNCAAKMGV